MEIDLEIVIEMCEMYLVEILVPLCIINNLDHVNLITDVIVAKLYLVRVKINYIILLQNSYVLGTLNLYNI